MRKLPATYAESRELVLLSAFQCVLVGQQPPVKGGMAYGLWLAQPIQRQAGTLKGNRTEVRLPFSFAWEQESW